MIGYLSGTLKCFDNLTIVLDVHGVGYSVRVLKIPSVIGEKMELFIHTHVREDQITLYGFETSEQLALFKILISIKGIGPKVAQSILANLGISAIYKAVANDDPETFCSVPGIGKKGAQRLILEMRSKIKNSLEVLRAKTSLDAGAFKIEQEATEALKNLGFDNKQIGDMIKKVKISNSDKVEDIIKMALSQR